MRTFGTGTTHWISSNKVFPDMPILIRDHEVHFLRLHAGILEIAPAKSGKADSAKTEVVNFDDDDDEDLGILEEVGETLQEAGNKPPTRHLHRLMKY